MLFGSGRGLFITISVLFSVLISKPTSLPPYTENNPLIMFSKEKQFKTGLAGTLGKKKKKHLRSKLSYNDY